MSYTAAKITVRRFTILSDFMDEYMPCDCNPKAWANWLSKPQPKFGRPAAAEDGDTFAGFTEARTTHKVFPAEGGFYAEPPMPEGWTSAEADDGINGVSDDRIYDLDDEPVALNERELADLVEKIGPYAFTVTRTFNRFIAAYRNTPNGPRLDFEILSGDVNQ